MYRSTIALPICGLAVALLGVVERSLADDPCWEQTIQNSDAEKGVNRFGQSFDLDGDLAVIGIGLANSHAYVFRNDPVKGWVEEQILVVPDVACNDFFMCGGSPAISGDTIIVGSALDDEQAEDAGAAYVFRYDGEKWLPQNQKLVAPDPLAGDFFGWAVAIDGSLAVIGSPQYDHNGSGLAHVFRLDEESDTWVHEAELDHVRISNHDWFGNSVAICGETIVIGSDGDNERGSFAGAAYVYRRNEGAWTQQVKLLSNDPSSQFGISVAIDGNPLKIAVGDPGADDVTNNSGAVHVYRDDGEEGWSLEAKLFNAEGTSDRAFAWSVDISDTPIWQVVAGAFAGERSYLFRSFGAEWFEIGEMARPEGEETGRMGADVAINGYQVLSGASCCGVLGGVVFVYDTGPACLCPADVDGNGSVAFGDILAILAAWGPCEGCPEDVSGNDVVDFADLLIVLAAWGPCV